MAEQALHEFIEEVSGESHLRVEHDFGDGFVRLHTSEAERRQAAQDIQNSENILLEMLRNAKDAHAAHIFVATGKEGNERFITMVDDGDGIPANMYEHIFEPRVTSKLDTSHKDAWGYHGRGMALYSISVNSKEARVVRSQEGLGSSISVVTDTLRLPERTDQSSFPTFSPGENNQVNVRGPRNLLRTACEFAIESRDTCSIFMGTTAETAAALWEYGNATLSSIDRAFCRNADELPLVKRLATASDPGELAKMCAELGLDISERTARRIMDGQVQTAQDMLERITFEQPAKKGAKSSAKANKPKNIKLLAREKQRLADAVSQAYSDIAESYYLDPAVKPTVTVNAERITVAVPIVHSS